MGQTVLKGESRVFVRAIVIQWLQKEILELQRLEPVRLCLGFGLWKHQLQFMAVFLNNFCTGLRAHTNPIQLWRRDDRPVGLNGNLEPQFLHGPDSGGIELQERLATRANNIGFAMVG